MERRYISPMRLGFRLQASGFSRGLTALSTEAEHCSAKGERRESQVALPGVAGDSATATAVVAGGGAR
jgi:hypothetical protein